MHQGLNVSLVYRKTSFQNSIRSQGHTVTLNKLLHCYWHVCSPCHNIYWVTLYLLYPTLPVLLIAQFRFAKLLDGLYIIVGVVMAIASGLALPGHMLLFGEVIDLFVSYELSQTILANRSLETILMAQSTNVSFYFCELNMLQQPNLLTFLMANDSAAQLQRSIGNFSLYYVALAIGLFITSFLATSLMNMSAYRQTRRMRIAFFRSILRQEIGWFDVNPTAELNNRLSE